MRRCDIVVGAFLVLALAHVDVIHGRESVFSPAIGNIDASASASGDSVGLEIVYSDPNGSVIAFKSDRTLLDSTFFPLYLQDGRFASSSPFLFDNGGSGVLAIAVFSENVDDPFCRLHIIQKTGSVWGIQKIVSDLPKAWSKPWIGRIDSAQTSPTVLFTGEDNCLYQYSLDAGTLLRKTSLTCPTYVVAGKIDGQGNGLQIAIIATNGPWRIMSADETTLATGDLGSRTTMYPVLFDTGSAEGLAVAFLSSSGMLHVVQYSTSDHTPGTSTLQLPTGTYVALTAGDWDNDGKCELLALSDAGRVLCIRQNVGSGLAIVGDPMQMPMVGAGDGWMGSSFQESQRFELYSASSWGTVHEYGKYGNEYLHTSWGAFSHVATVRVFDGVKDEDRYFSPNNDGIKDTVALGFFRVFSGVVAGQYQMTDEIVIKNTNSAIVRNVVGRVGAGSSLGWFFYQWDGRNDAGQDCPEGEYTYVYTARVTGEGQYSVTGKVYVDRTKPVVTAGFSALAFTSSTNMGALLNRVVLSLNVRDNMKNTGTAKIALVPMDTTVVVKTYNETLRISTQQTNGYSAETDVLWSGDQEDGGAATSGVYRYMITVQDLAGNTTRIMPVVGQSPFNKDNYVIINDAGIRLQDEEMFASPFLFNPGGALRGSTDLNFSVRHMLMEKAGTNLPSSLYLVELNIDAVDRDGNVVRSFYDWTKTGRVDLRNAVPSVSSGTRFLVTWDGKKDNGAVAAPGEYRFRVRMKDYFGNAREKVIPVQIDDPNPKIDTITRLGDGSYVIKGTAVNRRGFMHYYMEYRKQGQTSWSPLSVPKQNQAAQDVKYPNSNISYVHVDNGTLAVWDVFGLVSGDYEVRVTVVGRDGSYAAIKTIHVDASFLVRDVTRQPDFLSPDGDGIKDTMQLSYLLPDAAQFTMDVLDSNQSIVFRTNGSQATISNYPARFQLGWNGKNLAGDTVNAGQYLVKLKLSNGITSVDYTTNIQVHTTNAVPNGSTNINVALYPLEKNPTNGTTAYTLGIPYAWDAVARGVATPSYRVYSDVYATGEQMVTRYPMASVSIEMSESYEDVRVDRVSWKMRYHLSSWFGSRSRVEDRGVEIPYKNGYYVNIKRSAMSLLDNSTESDFTGSDMMGNDSQASLYHFNVKASDFYDYIGPDYFDDIEIVDRQIMTTNVRGVAQDITALFDWNINKKIFAVPLNGDQNTLAVIYGFGWATIAALITGEGVVAFIVCGVATKIAQVFQHTDSAEIHIPIKLNTIIQQDKITKYGYTNGFAKSITKMMSLSGRDGVVSNTYQGLHSEFARLEGILCNRVCKTNIEYHDFEYIPSGSKQLVRHAASEIESGSLVNKARTESAKYWGIRISTNQAGDPLVAVRNFYAYRDVIPWPMQSREQLLAIAPDVIEDHVLGRVSQAGHLSFFTNVAFEKAVSISDISRVSNASYFIPAGVSNLSFYQTIAKVERIGANGLPMKNQNSDVFPELISKIATSITKSANSYVMNMASVDKDDTYVLNPKLFGYGRVFIKGDTLKTNNVAVEGYWGSAINQGWQPDPNVRYSDWDINIYDRQFKSMPYLARGSLLDLDKGIFTIRAEGSVDNAYRKLMIIRGSTDIPGFKYYKLEYSKIENLTDKPVNWMPIPAISDLGKDVAYRKVLGGTMGILDVTDMTEGYYLILLTVVGVDSKGNSLVKQITSEPIWYNEPIQIREVTISPAATNGGTIDIDPDRDRINVTYQLSESSPKVNANTGVFAIIRNTPSGQAVRTLHGAGSFGINALQWDGKDDAGQRAVDGKYCLEIIAYDQGGGQPTVYKSSDHGILIEIKNLPMVISGIGASPPCFAPDGQCNRTRISYALSEPVVAGQTVTIEIRNTNNETLRTMAATGQQGENAVVWDGKNQAGTSVVAGQYNVKFNVTDSINLTATNLIQVESVSTNGLIASLQPLDENGSGMVKGISGNYFTWKADLTGRKSPNETASISFSAKGVNYKEIHFNAVIGNKVLQRVNKYQLHDNDALWSNPWKEEGNYNYYLDLTHRQKIGLQVEFRGTDNWSAHSRYSIGVYLEPSQQYAGYVYHRIEGDWEGTDWFTTPFRDGWSNLPEGRYRFNLDWYELNDDDYVRFRPIYVNKENTFTYETTVQKRIDGIKLQYRPEWKVWVFNVNGVLTTNINFSTTLPTLTSVDYLADFINKTNQWYVPYLYSSDVSYPFVLGDILIDGVTVPGAVNPPSGILVAAKGGNRDQRIRVETISNTARWMKNGQPHTNLLCNGIVYGVLGNNNIKRSTVDYNWTTSGVYTATVNAFQCVSNPIAKSFTDMGAVPSHVSFEYVTAEKTSATPNSIFCYFIGQGQMATNTNAVLLINSSNVSHWSSAADPKLTDKQFSGTIVIPYGYDRTPYNIDLFMKNQQNYNPETEGDPNGSQKNEIRVDKLNLELRKGDKVLVRVVDNIIVSNNSEVQLVDKDTRAALAERSNLQDYCSTKKIPINKWLEAVYVMNNAEMNRVFLEIKGTVDADQTSGAVTYVLEWGVGENPSAWQKIEAGGKANGVLGIWDISGRYGTYAILLTVRDAKGNVKQAKQVIRLGTGVSGDDVTIVTSPYGTTSLAFPAGSISDGDELFLKSKSSGKTVDAVVYGKFNGAQLPEGYFNGTTYSQAELRDVISMERYWLGGDAQSADPLNADLRTVLNRNSDLSNLTPGYSLASKSSSLADHVLINELYFKTDYDQFIEIYNPTSSAVDMSQFVIGDGEGQGAFPAGSFIKSNDFVVIARNAVRFKERFPGKRIDFEWDPLMYSGEDDPGVLNLLPVSGANSLRDFELNSSATRPVALIPLSSAEISQSIGSNQVIMGPVFDFKPDGLVFDPSKPPTLTYRGSLADLGGQDTTSLGVYYINNNNQVEFLASSKVTLVDTDGDGVDDGYVITAQVEHFSRYVMLMDTKKLDAPIFISMPKTYIKNGITVFGKALPLSTVQMSLNGKAIGMCRVSDAGLFKLENVLLAEGSNRFEARAIDDRGRASEIAVLENVMLDTVPPVLLQVDASRAAFSPNGDSRKDCAELFVMVNEQCRVVMDVHDFRGVVVATKEFQSGGGTTNSRAGVTWDGCDVTGKLQPEGRYRYNLSVYDLAGNRAGDTTQSIGVFTLDTTVPEWVDRAVVNPHFSPNGDGIKENTHIRGRVRDVYSDTLFLSAKVIQKGNGYLVKNLMTYSNMPAGNIAITWDGTDGFGKVCPDGAYLIEYSIVDQAGNKADITRGEVVLDTASPTGYSDCRLEKSILRQQDQLRVQFNLTESLAVTAQIVDTRVGTAFVMYSNQSSSSNYSIEWKQPLVSDGRYYCALTFADLAGNTARERLDFLYDGTKPTIDIPTASDLIKSGMITFHGTVRDDNFYGYDVWYRPEGSATNWTKLFHGSTSVVDDKVFTFDSGILNGLYSFKVQAYDTAGNTNQLLISSMTITNTIDRVFYYIVPRVYSTSNVAVIYGLYRDAVVSIDLLSKDDWSDARSLLGKTSTNRNIYTATWDFRDDDGWPVPDGNYVARFRAYCTGDGSVSESRDIDIIKDTVDPRATLFSPKDGTRYGATVDIVAGIEDDNLSYYSVSVARDDKSEAWQVVGEGSTSIVSNRIALFPAVGAEGAWKVKIRAADIAGNMVEKIARFTIDTTPVWVEIEKPSLLALAGGKIDVFGTVDAVDLRNYLVGGAADSTGELLRSVTNTTAVRRGILGTVDTRGLADGVREIRVVAYDATGNRTERRVSVAVDNTPPVVAIHTNLMAIDAQMHLGVVCTVLDAHLASFSISYRRQGVGSWSKLYQSAVAVDKSKVQTWDVSELHGIYELKLDAMDALGNASQAVVAISLQDERPIASITSPLANTHIKMSLEVVGIACASKTASAVLTIRDDSDLAVFTTNIQSNSKEERLLCRIGDTTRYRDGVYRIQLCVTDALGRTAEDSRVFNIDNTKPELRNVNVYPPYFNPGYVVDNGVTVGFEINEDVKSTISVYGAQGELVRALEKDVYRARGVYYVVWDGLTTAGIGVSGDEFKVVISVVDTCGNTAVTNVTVRIDQEPPTTSATYSTAPYVTDGNKYVRLGTAVTLIGTDAKAGIGHTYYGTGLDGAFQKYSGPVSFQANGAVLFRYYSIDKLGNREYEKKELLRVDGVAPGVAIAFSGESVVVGAVTYVSSNATVACEATGETNAWDSGLDRIEYRITQGAVGSGEWQRYEKPFTLTGRADGRYTLETRAIDRVGNGGNVVQRELYVDNISPTISGFSLRPQPFCVFTGSTNKLEVGYSVDTSAGIQAGVFDFSTNRYAMDWRLDAAGYKTLYPEEAFHWTVGASGHQVLPQTVSIEFGKRVTIGKAMGTVTVGIGGSCMVYVRIYRDGVPIHAAQHTVQGSFYLPINVGTEKYYTIESEISLIYSGYMWQSQIMYNGTRYDYTRSSQLEIPRNNGFTNVRVSARHDLVVGYTNLDLPPVYVTVKSGTTTLFSTNAKKFAWSTYLPADTVVDITTYNVTTDLKKPGVRYQYWYKNNLNQWLTRNWSGDSTVNARQAMQILAPAVSDMCDPVWTLNSTNPAVVLSVNNAKVTATAKTIVRQQWISGPTGLARGRTAAMTGGDSMVVKTGDLGAAIPADVTVTNWRFGIGLTNGQSQPLFAIALLAGGTNQVPTYRVDAGGILIKTLADWIGINAGAQTLMWDGKNDLGDLVGPGLYRVGIRSKSRLGHQSPFQFLDARVIQDNTPPEVALLSAFPLPFSPNGDGDKDATVVRWRMTDSLSTKLWFQYTISDSAGHLLANATNWTIGSGQTNQIQWSGTNADGIYTLVIKAKDEAGNVSAPLTMPLTIDLMSPRSSHGYAWSGMWVNTNVGIRFAAEDPVVNGVASGVSNFFVNTQGTWIVSPTNVVITQEGQTTVRYYAVDKAGNREAEKAIHVWIDKTLPVINLGGVAESAWYNHDVSPTLSVIEAHPRSVGILLNSIPYQMGMPISSEGAYLLTVGADDMAGNQASLGVRFSIDKTPPTSTVNIAQDGWYTTAVTAVFQAVDPVSGGVASGVTGFVARLGGSATTAYSNQSVVTIAQDGDYTFAYRAYDKAGNSEQLRQVAFHVDTVPPHLAFTGFTNQNVYGRQGIVPGVVITERALATNWMETSRDDSAYVYLASGSKLTAEGRYKIRAFATDKAGNTTIIEATFAIDTTPPSSPYGLCAQLIERNVFLAWTAATNADTAGYRLYRNGTLINTNQLLTNVHHVQSNVAPGTYAYQVSSIDWVGNESVKSAPVTIYATGYLTFVMPDMNAIACGSVMVRNAIGGRHNLLYSLEYASLPDAFTTNLVWQKIAARPVVSDVKIGLTWNTKRITDGRYLMKAEIMDALGNRHQATRIVRLDNTAPSTTLKVAGIDQEVLKRNQVVYTTNRMSVMLKAVDPTNGGVSAGVKYIRYRLEGGRHIDWSTWPSSSVPLSLREDGWYLLSYFARDTAWRRGNKEIIHQVKLVLDTRPPTIVVQGVEPGGMYARPVQPCVRIQDENLDAARTAVFLDDVAYDGRAPIVSDGAHTLRVVASDLAGNRAEKTVQFTIDRTAPAVVITGVENGKYYGQAVVPVIQFQDAYLTSVTMLLSGKPFVSGTQVAGDGAYLLEVTAIDRAGNANKASVTFTIDTHPPVVSVAGVTMGAYYPTSVRPVVTITEANVKSSLVTLNGIPLLPGTEISRDGSYRLSVTVEDMLGRKAETIVAFTVDRTPPSVNIVGVVDGKCYTNDVRPVVTVEDVNLDGCVVTLDGSPFVSGATVLTEGGHTLRITATDKANNPIVRTVAFSIDKSPPVITIAGVANDRYYNDDRMITVGASDLALESLHVKMNGKAIPDPARIPIRDEGEYLLEIVAKDEAGFVASAGCHFFIDRTPPDVRIRGIKDGGVYQSASPAITIKDDALDMSKSRILLNDVTYTNGTVVTNDGQYRLQVSAYDLAGNRTEKVLEFTVSEMKMEDLLLFYASFDNGTDADFAKGDLRNMEKKSRRTGRSGGYRGYGLPAFPFWAQGAMYHSFKNFDHVRGTVCMWVRPFWDSANYFGPDDGRWLLHFFRENGRHEEDHYLGLAVYKDRGTVATFVDDTGRKVEFAVDAGRESSRWYDFGRWTHLALAYDAEAGLIEVFIDGKSIGRTLDNPWTAKSCEYLRFGSRYLGVIGSLYGFLDELRVYGQPLSPRQVERVYREHDNDNNVQRWRPEDDDERDGGGRHE